MYFPGVIVNDSTAVNRDVDMLINGVPVPALKSGPFDVVFVWIGDGVFADGF